MKKIISYLSFITFFLIIGSLVYFSFFGIKTEKFNSQIKNTVNKFDRNINVDLDKILLNFNFKNLNIEAKTISPKITYKKKEIEIESIKTLISLKSFFKREFAIKDLYISTKSIKIKNILNLFPINNKSAEIYVFKNQIKSGSLVADIKINFDENGVIKDDFEIDGYVKDGQINLLTQYNLSNINFLFKIKGNKYDFNDIKISLNDLNFFSKEISLVNKNNNFYVQGDLEHKTFELDEKKISELFFFIPKNLKVQKISLNSKNIFSFKLNDKFSISELSINSKIDLDELLLKNEKKKGIFFFPNINDEIYLKNQKIDAIFKNNSFYIKGSGDALIQNQIDKVKYSLNNKNQLFEIKSTITLNENLFELKFLNYKKNKNSKAILDFKAKVNRKGEININDINFQENNNKILFENIFLNKDFKIVKIDRINLDYFDKDNKRNEVKISRNKNIYNLVSSHFNADSLISRILDSDKEKRELFQKNFEINLKIDQVYFDNENTLKNLNGSLSMKDNNVHAANISSFFLNNKRFVFKIKTENDQKITTLVSEKAQPMVKRYKFIKGFEEGTLDFYSKKITNKSTSRLKIFDFKLQELPALTKILTLASLQGIADTLTGEGIRFNELEMNFINEDNLMTIEELYAIGPAISILLNGYIEKDKIVSLRGTLVPATTINKTIGSLPLLGKILVGSKVGEGVFGVSFKIKGHPDKLETKVNPIKTLTPRFITRTLEKIKKTK